MLQKFIAWVKSIFVKYPIDEPELMNTQDFVRRYEDTTKVNFDYIFANSLSKKVVSGSTCDIQMKDDSEPSQRVEFIDNAIKENFLGQWQALNSQAIGKGRKIGYPYIKSGKACIDWIDQDRMTINEVIGTKITSVTILASTYTTPVSKLKYHRLVDMYLENGNYHEVQRAVSNYGTPTSLAICPFWENIKEERVIANVDNLLLITLDNATDSRRGRDLYKVPILFGADDLLRQIDECLVQIEKEYKNKRAFIGADDRMFNKGEMADSGLYKKFISSGTKNDGMWEVFSPEIRDSSLYNRLEHLMSLVEKQAGVSSGVVTKATSNTATATEILVSQYDTLTYVMEMRRNNEKAIKQMAYCFDVLAEYFGLTPQGSMGQWKVSLNWDMKLYESSSETYNQMLQLVMNNWLDPAKLNRYVTGQSIEDAKAEIEELEKNAPTLKQMLTE